MEIKDNVFVITGGASGLGAATAERIVSFGGKVILADLNESLGEELAQKLGGNTKFVSTDVTNEESALNCFEEALKFGVLRGVVNCAGVAPAESIVGRNGEPHQLKTFANTININLIGSFNMMRLGAMEMSKLSPDSSGERGIIINTASVAGYEGQLGQAAYSASKGGIISLTIPAARELARHGIRVMTIAPGIMETPMLSAMPEKVQESLANMIPFPSRMGYSSEYAQLVEHIILNRYLNGEVIRLDGAVRMGAR